jgi:NADPH2:quinone reductase
MKAIVSDASAPRGMVGADVAIPVPRPHELVVRMTAASVNYGTVAYLENVPDGTVRGSDGVGIVMTAAADGSGPPAGTRVAFVTPHGTWAELCAVPSAYAAPVPFEVDDATAAALPGAGLTALQAVRRLGSVLHKRVLVTGAAGGVGTFAVQLLARSGAIVTAWTRNSKRATGLTELGAQTFVTGAEQLEHSRFDAIIDTVGGDILTAALAHLTDNGTALNVGHTAGQATTINLEMLRRHGPGRTIEAFVCTDVDAAHLAVLLNMTLAGVIVAPIDRETPWDQFDDAVGALLARSVTGKAVLRIS